MKESSAFAVLRGGPSMGALFSWFVVMVLLIGGLVVLQHLGVDLTQLIVYTMHGVERALGRPITSG